MLTDEEARSLAGNLDSIPAGAGASGGSRWRSSWSR